jgi:hypothetical protein
MKDLEGSGHDVTEVLSQNLYSETEENQNKPESRQRVFRPEFEPSTYRKKV